MTRKWDIALVLTLIWAMATTPFLLLAYGFSGSFQNLIAGMGQMGFELSGFAIFTLMPWLLLPTMLLATVFKKH